MRKLNSFPLAILIISVVLLGISCNNKDDNEKEDEKEISGKIPELVTIAVTDISYSTAVSGGEITDDGGMEMLSKGICWSKDTLPTIDMNKTIDGTGNESYTSNVIDLEPLQLTTLELMLQMLLELDMEMKSDLQQHSNLAKV